MRIGICDDNQRDLQALKSLLDRLYPEHKVDMFDKSEALLSAVDDGILYALVFLDIIMPGQTGLEIATRLRSVSPKTEIVFLTSSRDYAVDAFSVNVLHYLIKPPTDTGVRECMQRLTQKNAVPKQQILLTTPSKTKQTLFVEEINYCESEDHYISFHLKQGATVRYRMTQTELLDALGDSFLPISRGLIVNMEFIRQLRARSCILEDGREVLLSRKNQRHIHEVYGEYVFSKLSD